MSEVIGMTPTPQPERPRWSVRAPLRLTGAVVLAMLAACGQSSAQSQSQIASADLNAGLTAQASGDLATATTDYKNAIAHDPHNKYAYYDLGLVEQLQGQSAAAEANYRAALQIDPNFDRALFNLAIIRTGPSPAEAEELYRHVIALDPNDASAYLNLGFLLISESRTAEGQADLRMAVQLDPSDASRIPPADLATPKSATPRP
jgi:Tfp pilus assembly protein PilF